MKKFRYAVLGAGKWGKRIEAMLRAMPRSVNIINLSRPDANSDLSIYTQQLSDSINRDAADADIVWVAVPPGQQNLIVRTLLSQNKHVLIEKPWICDKKETASLIELAKKKGLFIGINYQFCFLEEIKNISEPSKSATGFSGQFTTSKHNRLSIPSLYNLGSHLIAIKCLYFPLATIDEIKTGYDECDKRFIKITFPERVYEIDFLNQHEPLIQRLVEKFEYCISANSAFPLNLNFATRVYDELKKIERNKNMKQ